MPSPFACASSNLGFFLTKSDSGLLVYTLSWPEPTYFRPICPPSGNEHESDWFCWLPRLVRSAGRLSRITFLERPFDLDPYCETPYARMSRTIRTRAGSDKPAWASLLAHNGIQPTLPFPGDRLAMQGWLYGRGNRPFGSICRRRAMLILTPTAAASLGELLPDEATVEGFFSPQNRQLLQFAQASDNRMPDGWRLVRTGLTRACGEHRGHTARFIAPIGEPYVTFPTSVEEADEFVSWDRAIRQLSVVEQIALLRSAFGEELVQEVFEDSPFVSLLAT